MKRLLFILFLAAFQGALFAQQAVIKGQVVDSKSKEPLIGVTVTAAEGKGATTDLEGNFTIEVEAGRYELKFSYVGYSDQVKDVKVNTGETVEVRVLLIEKLEELDIVVVTGSKFSRQVSQEVSSIDVLKPSLLKNVNAVTLAEGINKISGITMLDNSIGIRGGSTYAYGVGSRVLLLVDDLPVMTADRGDIRWNNVPLEIAEQVEVIKGASSALYGASALNGVINVHTAYPKSEEGETEVNLFYHAYAPPRRRELKWWGPPTPGNIANPNDPDVPAPYRYGGNLSFKKRVDRFDFVVGANYLNERGIIRMLNQNFVRFTGKFRHRPEKFDRLSYGLNVNMQSSRETDYFFWENANNGAYIPSGSTGFRDDGNSTNYDKQIVTLDPWTIYHDRKGNKHLIRGRYQYQATQFGSNFPLFHLLMGEYQFQRTFRRNLTLTSGFMGQYFKVNDPEFGQFSGNMTALYAQVDKTIGRVTIVAGARWELYKIDDEFGYLTPVLISGEGSNVPIPVGQLGVNYRAGKRTYLRVNSGMGFRIPSITERFVEASAGPIYAFSNPDVKPEFGISGELGLKQGIQISKWLSYLDLAFFWMEYWELVEYRFGFYQKAGTTESSFGFKALNTSRARVGGFEFSFTGDGKIGKIPLRLIGGYTYTYPVELSKNGDTTLVNAGRYLKNMFTAMGPINDDIYRGLLGYRYRHLLKADAEVDINKFTFGAEFQYYSFMDKIEEVFALFIKDLVKFREDQRLRRVEGDIFFNVRAAYDMNKFGRVSLIVYNVLNRESAVRIAKMDPPTNIVLQYRIRIGGNKS